MEERQHLNYIDMSPEKKNNNNYIDMKILPNFYTLNLKQRLNFFMGSSI